MGKQSPALDRDRWRCGLDDAAECLGRHLAHSEATDFVDKRKRRQRHSHSRKIKSHGAHGFPNLARQRILFHTNAVLHGSRQPLPDVWEVEYNAQYYLCRGVTAARTQAKIRPAT